MSRNTNWQEDLLNCIEIYQNGITEWENKKKCEHSTIEGWNILVKGPFHGATRNLDANREKLVVGSRRNIGNEE